MASKSSVLLFGIFVAFAIVNCSRVKRATQEQCGEPRVPGELIFSGIVSKRDQWPWLVALFDGPKNKFFCGGSLVSRRHILTAAHCLQGKNIAAAKSPSDVVGYLGKYDLKVPHERGAVLVYPDRISIHPDWKPMEAKYDADIAMIKIDDDAPMRQNIYPVCLWTEDLRIVREDDGTVVGWGTSENQAAREHENIPHEVVIKVVTNEVCYTDEFLAKIISHRTFCGGGENSGPCRGDSGGGLYTPRGSRWYIRGIVSASLFKTDGTCDVNKYAVFTKVEKFVGWINSIMGLKIEMNCEYSLGGDRYYCSVRNFKIPNDNIRIVDTTGDHAANQDNNNVNELVIHNQQTPYLPVKISEIFPNLLKYFAGASGLKHIKRVNFEGLTSLTQIEFGVNNIETIPKDTFYDLVNLDALLLHNNNIEVLDRDLFINNPNLKVLYIYGNKIEFLDQGLFRNNAKLEGIHIDNNKLMFIEPALLDPLKNLKVANFQSNVCLSEHFPNSGDKAHLKRIFATQCKI